MSRQDCRRQLAVRQGCVDESHSLCGVCCPGEWLWVDSNDKNGKRTFRIDGSFSRHFSSICIVRELSLDEVGSRSRGSGFWKKMTACGKILKISFRKDSPRRRTTSCVHISSNLTDRKSVKSCVIYRTKKTKIGLRSRSSSCADRIQNLAEPAPNNVLGVPQISSKSVHF